MVDEAAWRLRRHVYEHLAAHGRAPDRGDLVGWAGSDDVDVLLRELHQRHALVLDESGEIRMALPFSAIPTDHRVVSGDRSWWANCAWDALAIPAALGIDASIEATWLGAGDPVELAIVEGELADVDGFVHFVVPARRWWDDIVET
jgi:hypothetical protein